MITKQDMLREIEELQRFLFLIPRELHYELCKLTAAQYQADVLNIMPDLITVTIVLHTVC